MVRVIICAIILISASGCQTTGSSSWQTPGVSGEAEALIGRRSAPILEERFGGTVCYAIALERTRYVGRRLAAANPELAIDWQFSILASDKVNAFSLPGGLVYITRGLYERRIGEDNDLLAAVIAHEMGHVVRKDSLRPTCHDSREALDREMAADRCAARYLVKAGYDIRCLIDLLRLIKDVQPPGWYTARIEALSSVDLVSDDQPGAALITR